MHRAADENDKDSHYEIMELFLKNGADPNVKNYTGVTPLFNLFHNANLNVIKLFLNHNADIEVIDSTGTNLLFLAVCFNTEVLEFLLDRGFNVNHRNAYGATSLIISVSYNTT